MSTVGVEGAAVLLRVGHNKVREMISNGELRAAQFGRSYVMLEKDVMDLIEKRAQAQTDERLGVPLTLIKKRSKRGTKG